MGEKRTAKNGGSINRPKWKTIALPPTKYEEALVNIAGGRRKKAAGGF